MKWYILGVYWLGPVLFCTEAKTSITSDQQICTMHLERSKCCWRGGLGFKQLELTQPYCHQTSKFVLQETVGKLHSKGKMKEISFLQLPFSSPAHSDKGHVQHFLNQWINQHNFMNIVKFTDIPSQFSTYCIFALFSFASRIKNHKISQVETIFQILRIWNRDCNRSKCACACMPTNKSSSCLWRPLSPKAFQLDVSSAQSSWGQSAGLAKEF